MATSESITKTELRDKRLQELLNSCQDQILQQIIGPFGLNPAMFDDKEGGNVTTMHNFEQGIVATEEDKAKYGDWKTAKNGGYQRKGYDSNRAASGKQASDQDSDPVSAYTGKTLNPDDRPHSDHVISVKQIETDPNAQLFMDSSQRVDMANAPENLVASEGGINQSMQDKDKRQWADSERKKDPGKTNAESFGVDRDLLDKTVNTAEKHVSQSVLVAQLKKQGAELAVTGAKEAAKNALRQALGLAMHTFVHGAFVELKPIMLSANKTTLVDDIISAFKRVILRVKDKLKHILEAGLSGLIQGFVSNLITFLINNIITTAAKVVTVIREGMKGLWRAVKLMAKPPEGMSSIEIAREVSKIIAAVITTSLGLVFEEAIRGFLASIPILIPLLDILSPVITGILTGVATALIVYGLDRFFDWLSVANPDKFLLAMESNLEATQSNIETMCDWLESQFNNSKNYTAISQEYRLIEIYLSDVQESQSVVLASQRERISANNQFNSTLASQLTIQAEQESDLMEQLENYLNKENH